MPIEKKPFKSYTLEEDKKKEKREIITISLNKEERKRLELDKKKLQQVKDGTAIKQLMEIGHNVIHDDLTGHILGVVLQNRNRNKRTGVAEYE